MINWLLTPISIRPITIIVFLAVDFIGSLIIYTKEVNKNG